MIQEAEDDVILDRLVVNGEIERDGLDGIEAMGNRRHDPDRIAIRRAKLPQSMRAKVALGHELTVGRE
jgi:hypothetical protein